MNRETIEQRFASAMQWAREKAGRGFQKQASDLSGVDTSNVSAIIGGKKGGSEEARRSLFRAALVRAGITRRIRPYDLRHLAASAMLDAGADLKSVSEILGHASPDMTLRTYQHTSTTLRREAIGRLGNPLPTVTRNNNET